MKKRYIIYIFIFFICFFTASNKVNAYVYDVNINNQSPYYDITKLEISNNQLTISGWAFIDDKDNGKFNDTKVEFSPKYTVYVVDNNGNDVAYGSYYLGDNANVPQNTFSGTCTKFTQNVNNQYAKDCMDAPTYSKRNQMVEAKVNGAEPNRYYDGIDFNIIIDISKLKHDVEYHLELKMNIQNYESKRVELLIQHDRVQNNPEETKITHKNTTKYVKFVADLAIPQRVDSTFWKPASLANQCWYNNKNNINYEVSETNPEEEFSGINGVKFYYYGLKVPYGGLYGAGCSNINSLNQYINGDLVAYAYSTWVQPYGETGFILEKMNPCIEGTETETPMEYAINNPGVCCYEIPETCCGNKTYIEELYEINPSHYLFSDKYCCSDSNDFIIDNGIYSKKDKFYTFQHYFPYNQLESFKNFNDRTEYYSQSFINSICEKKEWAGRSCKEGTVDREDTKILSMQYVNKNNISNTITHKVYMELDRSDVIIDDIAVDFFSDQDFEQYIKNNSSGSEFKNINDKVYALNNKNFNITINNVEKRGTVGSGENVRYKYEITFSINITSLTGATPNSKNLYFLPVKLWYCEEVKTNEKQDCSNSTYFKNNKTTCCKQDPDREGCACDSTTGEMCYTWSTASSCTEQTSNFANRTNTKELTNGDEIISEKITFDNYPTFDKMQTNKLKAGTGFEYEIKVTHTITSERHWTGTHDGSTANINCDTTNCKSSNKTKVDNFYANVKRNTNDDISKIKNLKYVFDGKTSYEDYEIIIDNDDFIKSVNDTDKVKICKISNVYDLETGKYISFTSDCDTYTYDSKITYTYTYTLRLKQKYISKLHASSDDTVNIISAPLPSSKKPKDYLDGENKFYTKLNASNGIYPINIYLSDSSKGGITGELTGSEKFTCQYEIIGGIKNNEGDNSGKSDEYYYFRPISLFSPFPNGREIGKNWKTYCSNGENCKYITTDEENNKKQDTVYGNEPMYEITLTSDIIKQIKEYNRSQSNNYGWRNMTTHTSKSTTSDFLTNNKYINWGDNLTINVDRDIKTGDFKISEGGVLK